MVKTLKKLYESNQDKNKNNCMKQNKEDTENAQVV